MKKIILLFLAVIVCNTILATGQPEVATTAGPVSVRFDNFQYPLKGSPYICVADLICSDATEVTFLLTIANGTSDSPDIYFWIGDNECFMSGNGNFEMTVPVSKGTTSVKIQGASNTNASIYMTILPKGNIITTGSTIFGVY